MESGFNTSSAVEVAPQIGVRNITSVLSLIGDSD